MRRLRQRMSVGFWLALGAAGSCTRTQVVEGFPDSFVGVGLELTVKDGQATVVRAIDGGPAAVAGVKPGDRILEVNGQSTAKRSLGDVVMQLRGKPDTQVTLSVDRAGTRLVVVLRRSKLKKGTSDYHAAE